jgi:hypothetical protein
MSKQLPKNPNVNQRIKYFENEKNHLVHFSTEVGNKEKEREEINQNSNWNKYKNV